jgi:hypothetical protein
VSFGTVFQGFLDLFEIFLSSHNEIFVSFLSSFHVLLPCFLTVLFFLLHCSLVNMETTTQDLKDINKPAVMIRAQTILSG